MRRRRNEKTLGNKSNGVSHYIIAFIINAIIHLCIFLVYNFKYYDIPHFIISYIFFTYPICFIWDIVWTLKPSVYKLLNGTRRVNRKYYMNELRTDYNIDDFFSVTISIPVYLEDNAVIFETLKDSIEAADYYREKSGKYVNIIVSDDGIGAVIRRNCNQSKIDELVYKYKNEPDTLSEELKQIAERIIFYRENDISFVARPAYNRVGLFKKASNLNYTLTLGDQLEDGYSLNDLMKTNKYKDCYAEGDIITNEVILLLDKDSGVNKKIIFSMMPEFTANNKLAYIQCATNAVNTKDNFFAKTLGCHTNNLFHNIWPSDALKGFFTPLVGHNVFIRKSILKRNGYWDENKVSEDYDAAIRMYSDGYHGKYAQVHGLEFTEYASRTYTEEASKQYRYTYGLFEMIFNGTINYKRARKRDIFYMVIYFLSKVYIVATIPYALFVAYIGDINIMWAGFILCQIIFILLPFLRGLLMRRKIKKEYLFPFKESFILSLSYLGYSFSSLLAAIKFILNKFKLARKSFPATAVGNLNYCFSEGLIILNDYVTNNLSFLIIAVLCSDRIVSIISRHYALTITKITCTYILLGILLVPFILTPHFYHVNFKNKNAFKNINMIPVISLIAILVIIPSFSYKYYITNDREEQMLRNTNSISLINPISDFPYIPRTMKPGETKNIHFEVTNTDETNILKVPTKYSIMINKNKSPFRYKLKCRASKGECISVKKLKTEKHYINGLMPTAGIVRHNYTLSITWKPYNSGNKVLDTLVNSINYIRYSILPNKRINIRVLANEYIYNVIGIKNEEYNRGSNKVVKINTDATKKLLTEGSIYIDGYKINKNCYKISKQAIIFNKNYLNTISTGNHAVRIILANGGEITTRFYIKK